MSADLAPIAKKKTVEQEAMDAMTLVYNAATAADQEATLNLVRRAVGAAQSVEIVTYTPGMAARLFFDHNKQNREWKASTSREYARQMMAGEWSFNNQGIGFLKTGNVGDGQHRLAGVVLANMTIDVVTTFGLEDEAIVTLDTGMRRQAGDYLHIEHVESGRRKAEILRSAFSYLARQGDATKVLRSVRDTAKAAKHYETHLTEALIIGEQSVIGIAKPVLTVKDAQGLAFLLLVSGWPRAVILDKLQTFQRGQSTQGENSPGFLAAKILDRDAAKKGGVMVTGRYAATVQAFRLEELGIKAAKASAIRDVMKSKALPNPKYPVSG